MKKFFKWVVIAFGILYIIGCVALYVMQDSIIFRPSKISQHTTFRFGEEISLKVDDDVDLHGLYHKEHNARGAILYLHGNRGNARWCQRQAEMFSGLGYDVLLLDYRGYGKSEGRISSSPQLYNDVQVAYDYLKTKFDESKIIVAGYSLGTGMASYLAAYNKPWQLLLIAPFVSIPDMKDRIFPFIPDFLIKYPLDNKLHLSKLTCPVTIFHGTDDEVIPYDSSEDLKRFYPDKVNLITLSHTSHRRAIFHEGIRTFIGQYL